MENYDYVQFFSLVDEADYVLACLLHRFFRKMRARAVEVFNSSGDQRGTKFRSYGKGELLPIEFIVKVQAEAII